MTLKKLWHDPVWSKVIAVVIISILGTVLAYLKGWFPGLELTLKAIWHDPVWSWIIVGVVVSILMAVLLYSCYWFGYNFKDLFPKLTKTGPALAKPEQEVIATELAKPEQEVITPMPRDITTILQTCNMPQNDVLRLINYLEALPPLLVADLTKHYIGLTVDWLTEYSSARKRTDSLIRVCLFLITDSYRPIQVWCEVDLLEYKRFSILKSKAKIRVTGNIVGFHPYYVELSNVRLYFEQDDDAHQDEIREKENQLRQLQGQLTALNTLIEDSDLVCPKCKAPLVTRASHTIYGPGDIDVDIEYLEYECGLSIDGGTEKSPCRSSGARP